MSARLLCTFCNKTFVNSKTLKTHTLKYHPQPNPPSFLNASNNNTDSLLHKTANICYIPDKEYNDFKTSFSTFITSQLYSCLFKIALLNINSLLNKFHDLTFVLDQQLVDILVINETRLTDRVCDTHFKHRYYSFYRRDRGMDSSGGGIMVFVKKSLKHFNVIIDYNIEMISLIIEPFLNYKIAVLACYRPPRTDNENLFFAGLESRLTQLDKTIKETFIIGDLNYDLSSVSALGVPNKLCDFTSANGFVNSIKEGTRYNPKKDYSTLLDVILCRNSSTCIASKAFPCPFSDHSLVTSVLNFRKSPNFRSLKSVRCLNTNSILSIQKSLSFILSKPLGLTSDVNLYWSLVKDVIASVLDSHAPFKLVPVKSINKAPWLDKELVHLSKKRNKIHRKALFTKNKEDWSSYKILRNKVASLFSLKKIFHFKNFISNSSTSSKKLWTKLNPFINPNKKSSLAPALILKNTSNNSSSDLSNVFCNFFSSILSKFTFLSLPTCLNYTDNLFKSNSLLSSFLNPNKFSIDRFEISEVVDSLKALDENSAAGAVNIDTKIFKHCADQLGPTLTELFNLCLIKSEIPNEWKIAYVTPVYKSKGDKSDLNSYRPISVISPIAKVFETLVSKKMLVYLEGNNILHNSQYGFRPGRSCELALNTIVDDWRDKLDEKQHVVSVFLDLSKAFDTVDHALLLRKLYYYNFSGNFIKLISSTFRTDQ